MFLQNGKAEFVGLLRIGKDGTLEFAIDEGTVLMPCLVRCDGYTLSLCIPAGEQRPRGWSGVKGSGQGVTMFRRKH
jgi:hypothetical protein